MAGVASPPKNDAWPPLRWDQQRFVIIRRPGALLPYLGYVLEWPVSGMGGRILVAYADEGVSRAFKIEWMERRQLIPVRIDVNEIVSANRSRRQ